MPIDITELTPQKVISLKPWEEGGCAVQDDPLSDYLEWPCGLVINREVLLAEPGVFWGAMHEAHQQHHANCTPTGMWSMETTVRTVFASVTVSFKCGCPSTATSNPAILSFEVGV